MTNGQIVIVKKGKEKGLFMVVMSVDLRYVYLADGKTCTIERPKKKNIKHIQITNCKASLEPECGRALNNADIRNQIKKITKP